MRSFFMCRLLLFVLFFCACNGNPSNTTASKDTVASSQTIHNNVTDTVVTGAKPIMLNGCYQMILKPDTTTLHLTVKDTTVAGTLKYNWPEKASETGTVNGVLRNDTIYTQYVFQSGGATSGRDLVFKIQNDTLLQGSAEFKEQNGKIIVPDRHKLQFQIANAFVKINCR